MENNRTDGDNIKLQIVIQPNSNGRHLVVAVLNKALADEAVLTIKTRSAHWNVSGAGFLELHILYNTQYKQLNEISGEIAGRALVLGEQPIGSFEEFLKNTRLAEKPGVTPNIMDLLADHEAVIRYFREDAHQCLEKYEDEFTSDFLVNILSQHKKMAAILRSHIEPQLTRDER